MVFSVPEEGAMSEIESLVQQGWSDHERDSAGVLERLGSALGRIVSSAEIPPVAALLTHVAGEHLGRWDDGLALLDRIAALPVHDASNPDGQALARSRAVLLLCSDRRSRAFEIIPDSPSARIRVLAVAGSALAGQRRTAEGIALFEEALGLAAYGPDKTDPAARALAVTGNNLAAGLEERPGRTKDEDRLLELASKTARRYWEVAGSWVEVERAEYRLAMTYVALGRGDEALEHAQLALRGCEENDADASELFFAREALLKAHHVRGDHEKARAERAHMTTLRPKLDPSLESLAEETLEKVDRLIPT
jgi:tetratricopeptide (TPR) repeat protein